MENCNHIWYYSGIINDNVKKSYFVKNTEVLESQWTKRCIVCNRIENTCEHSWSFHGTFATREWKQVCNKCDTSKIVNINDILEKK